MQLYILNTIFYIGEGAQFCKYDTLSTRSLVVGNATLLSFMCHQTLMQDLESGMYTGVTSLSLT